MNKTVLKYVLKNELEHGKADAKIVLAKVMGSEPQLRPKIKEIAKEIHTIIKETSNWSDERKKQELLRLWPNALEKKKEEPKESLKALKNARGNVVMRFAPNPNGPPTLGSSRGIVINYHYCKEYNGKFICRFDDTDPSLKKPLKEAYDWYLEDMEWLGCPPDKVIFASDRIEEYYKVAEELLMKRCAYICQCNAKKARKLKAEGKACPCRNQSQRDAMQLWRKMLDGGFAEGEAVLRVKTDIAHKNPAIRDWVGFRIRYSDHPRVGKKYIVWPMLDFESAVEDHLQGVTHIVRGKDLRDSTERQKYLYSYMGWEYPETSYWGRVAVDEFGKLSTSGISEGIKTGKYSGWDDIRLPTIRALRRRGFDAKAIKQFWIDVGISEKDVKASMKTIEAFNRSIIDPKAKRYFFVANPKKITVKKIPSTHVKLANHPQQNLGQRDYFFKGEQEFFVPQTLKLFRLKGAFNIKKEGNEYFYAGEELLDCPKLQWVSDALDAELVTPEGTQTGVVERYVLDSKKGQRVQLERVGYARIDEITDKKAIFWLTHL